mmetsp:Transcript_25762/g.74112  ORF Transcript_25762/g.74112 Transcript_25762/m.74112 type:complete len:231 (-) Transcript_25762:62-754(-)
MLVSAHAAGRPAATVVVQPAGQQQVRHGLHRRCLRRPRRRRRRGRVACRVRQPGVDVQRLPMAHVHARPRAIGDRVATVVGLAHRGVELEGVDEAREDVGGRRGGGGGREAREHGVAGHVQAGARGHRTGTGRVPAVHGAEDRPGGVIVGIDRHGIRLRLPRGLPWHAPQRVAGRRGGRARDARRRGEDRPRGLERRGPRRALRPRGPGEGSRLRRNAWLACEDPDNGPH